MDARPMGMRAAIRPRAVLGTPAWQLVCRLHHSAGCRKGYGGTDVAVNAPENSNHPVCGWASNGSEFAAWVQQGITMDAVKFHLKTAFAKTGLRSQARLLQAVARALAELGLRRCE